MPRCGTRRTGSKADPPLRRARNSRALTLQRALVEMRFADPDTEAAVRRATGERVSAACEQQERMIDALLTLARNDEGSLVPTSPSTSPLRCQRTALGNMPHPVLPTPTRAITVTTPEQQGRISEATGRIVVR